MEMHQIRYFLAVARERNFTRAAEQCHVSQPSLTRAIQKLEEEFGGLLFRRERALTHLTELGRLMLPHLERSYEAAQAARTLARQVERAKLVPLSLGLAHDVHLPGLPTLFLDLARAFEGFELSLRIGSSESLLEAAMAGDLDVVIAELGTDPPERIDHWVLCEEREGLVLRKDHPLAGLDSISAEQLAGLSFIALGDGIAARLATALPAPPPTAHRAGSIAAAALLVAGGLGVALLPERLPLPAETCWRPVEGLNLERNVTLAAVAGRQRSVAADAFVKSARARGWSAAA